MSVLLAIVSIVAGLVSIVTGAIALWKKATESKSKQELAEKTVALATCQRIQAWQWAALFALVIAVLILVPRLSLPRAA